MLCMGVALVTKCVVNACPRRQRQCYISIHFIVGGTAALVWKLGKEGVLQCTEVSRRSIRVAQFLSSAQTSCKYGIIVGLLAASLL